MPMTTPAVVTAAADPRLEVEGLVAAMLRVADAGGVAIMSGASRSAWAAVVVASQAIPSLILGRVGVVCARAEALTGGVGLGHGIGREVGDRVQAGAPGGSRAGGSA